jgi:hypothetical protein
VSSRKKVILLTTFFECSQITDYLISTGTFEISVFEILATVRTTNTSYVGIICVYEHVIGAADVISVSMLNISIWIF